MLTFIVAFCRLQVKLTAGTARIKNINDPLGASRSVPPKATKGFFIL